MRTAQPVQTNDSGLIARFVHEAQHQQRIMRGIATKYRHLKALYAASEYLTGLCGEKVDVIEHAICDLESEIVLELNHEGVR
jgi:hypothetical protein